MTEQQIPPKPSKDVVHQAREALAQLGLNSGDAYKLRMVEVVTKENPRDFAVNEAQQFPRMGITSEERLNTVDKMRFNVAGLQFSLGTVYDMNNGERMAKQLTGDANHAMQAKHYAQLMGYLKEKHHGAYQSIIADGVADAREINAALGELQFKGITLKEVLAATAANPTHVISQAYQPGQFNEDLEANLFDDITAGKTQMQRLAAGASIMLEKKTHPKEAAALEAFLHPKPADGKIEVEVPYIPIPFTGKKPGGIGGK